MGVREKDLGSFYGCPNRGRGFVANNGSENIFREREKRRMVIICLSICFQETKTVFSCALQQWSILAALDWRHFS